MHQFEDLLYRSTSFTLKALGELSSFAHEEASANATTNVVQHFQMIQLQKAIIASYYSYRPILII